MFTYKPENSRVPITIWLDEDTYNSDIELVKQAENTSRLPFIRKHIVVLPDAHLGYGIPIGCVIACKDVIIPHAVGSDISCGVLLLTFDNLFADDVSTETLKTIMGKVREAVPVGMRTHGKAQSIPTEFEHKLMDHDFNRCIIADENYDNMLKSIGTLGSGNHFWQCSVDEDKKLSVMIHCGSRNLGYQVCKYYDNVAREFNKEWYSSVPPEYQLAFLPLYSDEGERYWDEMKFCMDFAEFNRYTIGEKTWEIFEKVLKTNLNVDFLDVNHNFAAIENHFGENLVVHRKGATRAYEGELGLIPGSQGSSSFVVKGKGNPNSFKSCSHGAGRILGRKQAQKTLDLKTEQKILDDQDIIHSIRNVNNLDEATGAYKDVNLVMKQQEDLVETVKELKPIAVIKGD